MPKYKVGDVLNNFLGDKIKILEVTANLYAWDWFEERYGIRWSSHEELEKTTTLAQPARWVPEMRQEYWFLAFHGLEQKIFWQGDDYDHFRLSIGNVFPVGDHAGIEALKKRWQEGV